MFLGSGYLGDFLGDPFASTTNQLAERTTGFVKFTFDPTDALPPTGVILAYSNGVIIDRTLVDGETFAALAADALFASPGIPGELEDGVYDPLGGLSLALYDVAWSFAALNTARGNTLTVRRLNWQTNQARVMDVEHACKIDSADILTEGFWLFFEDSELGRVFHGKIVEVEKNYKKGEGVTYRLACAYRTFTKTPARRDFRDNRPPPTSDFAPGTSHLRFDRGDLVSDVITRIVELKKQAVLPGGLAFGLAASTALTSPLDKVGQSIAQWIDDALEQTEGGIAYIDPATRRLMIRDFYNENTVTLTQGTYTVLNPTAANPLLVEGGIKSTLNEKFENISIEGVGRFERKVNVACLPVYQNDAGVENPAGTWLYTIRLYFPDLNVLDFFWDELDVLRNEIHIDFTYQIGLNTPVVIGLTLAEAAILVVSNTADANFNKPYYDWNLIFNHTGQPTVQITDVLLRYTAMLGPLVVSAASTDSRMQGEGEYLIQRPDLYRFYSPGFNDPLAPAVVLELPKDVNPTAEMQTQANAKLRRYGTRPDVGGKVSVHIKALTASIVPGTLITNFDARVRAVEFDLYGRNLILDLSDVPIRREAQDAKDAAVFRSENQRQKNVNLRYGAGDKFLPVMAFNKRQIIVQEDCCEECDCVPAS